MKFSEWEWARLQLAKLDRVHRLILFLFLAGVVFMGVGTARHFYLAAAAKKAARQDNGAAPPAESVTVDMIEVRNETKTLEVVSKKIEKEFLVMEVRNVGQRPIICYRVELKGSDRFVTDLSAGGPLAPSLKTNVTIAVKKLTYDQQSKKFLATFSMALFADGQGEGDPAKVASQRDRMSGQALAFTNMTEMVDGLQSEADFASQQFAQHLHALKGLMPAGYNRDQAAGYVGAIQSMQARAMVLNKLPDNRKAADMRNFKNAFARQTSNLRMFRQEAK